MVIGAGAIGLELGQALARLGARVTMVEVAPRLLPAADPEMGDELAELLARGGHRAAAGRHRRADVRARRGRAA